MNIDPRMVLDSIYNGIVVIDSEGIIAYFNKTAEKIFNIPSHEAMGRFILEILPNTGGKLVESLKAGKAFYREKLRGEKVGLISNINPVMEDGQIIGAISVFQDISEIENISRELDGFKNMKKWLDTVIDSSYDGLWICDQKGTVIQINKACERIDGVKPEEVVGKNVRDLVARGILDKSVTLEVLKRKASVTMIQRVKGEKTFLVTGNPIFDENGEITFVVSNDRDITELDRIRSQLQETQALARGYLSKLSELELKWVDVTNIVFRSEEMRRVLKLAQRVSEADSTVLLLGESGVGKGMVAKLIHKHSERKDGPFIRVDCSGIPESLIESELFGYDKGAFTGAKTEGKLGLFELANEGSLFLDEIGEIPQTIQSKLLRFLEEHEVIRVGGTEPRQINVRIIAATNKNIEEMVQSKNFRKDLYYRLNVVPIHIPPLRERREDIIPLVFHFLERLNASLKKKKALAPDVIESLCRYDFPGNIRELANVIERIVVLSEKDDIGLDDLPKTIIKLLKETAHDASLPEEMSLKEAVGRYERLIIDRMVRKYGSQRKAAKVLQVDHATLARKVRRLPVSRNGSFVHHAVH